MKTARKLVCAILLLLFAVSFATGCTANGETKPRTKATVLQVHVEQGFLLIELDEGSFYANGRSVRATIPVDDPEDYKPGDRISFYVGGDILEMAPLSITAPRDVKKILW